MFVVAIDDGAAASAAVVTTTLFYISINTFLLYVGKKIQNRHFFKHTGNDIVDLVSHENEIYSETSRRITVDTDWADGLISRYAYKMLMGVLFFFRL